MNGLSRNRLILGGLALAVATVVFTDWLSWSNMRTMTDFAEWEVHTQVVIRELGDLLSSLKDVETGERGYIISGKEEYLEPYNKAFEELERKLALLKSLTKDNPRQQEQLARVEPVIRDKLEFVRESIHLRKKEGYPAAVSMIRTGRGKQLMDQIRGGIKDAQNEEEHLLRERRAAKEKSVGRTLYAVAAGTTLSLALILTVFTLLWREIARRETVEKRLRERTQEVETAYEEMKTMSYYVAHDLRGPLRGVTNFAQLLERKSGASLDEQGQHYLERISSGSRRIGTIIDGMLLLSEIGRRSVVRKALDLSAMAAGIADGLKKREPARTGDFLIQEGMTAEADEALLQIALGHLLENAWKFTQGSREPRIEFFMEPRDEGKTYIVRDNGVGFDAEYTESLFVPFQRLHREDEFHGVGIGLAIVKMIILSHHGTISAEGALGKGAAFHFTLGEDGGGNA